MDERHVQLFSMKFREQISNNLVLAERLGITEPELSQLSEELDEHLQSKIKVLTAERLALICPSCMGARVLEDTEKGERVCTECGFTEQLYDYDTSLSFDTTYALASDLSVNHSLGAGITLRDQIRLQRGNGEGFMSLAEFKQAKPDMEQKIMDGEVVLDEKNAYWFDGERNRVNVVLLRDVGAWVLGQHVLSKADREKIFHLNDIPLRVRRMRVMTCTENPELDLLLHEAYELSKQFRLSKDFVFNNSLGANIRRAYWLIHEMKLKIKKGSIADSMFYYTLSQGNRVDLIMQSLPLLDLNQTLIVCVLRLNQQLKALVKSTLKEGDLLPESGMDIVIRELEQV